MEVPKTISKPLLISLLAAVALLAIAWRLTPHTPNFAPVGAIALAVGAIAGWRASLLTVLVIMGLSDLLIGGYVGIEWTWLGLGLIGLLGFAIKRLPLGWQISAGALGSSGIFFIVSNFGTWIASGMYSLDLSGLIQCYVMALPFLKATLLSDLVFTTTILASYWAIRTYLPLATIAPQPKTLP